MLDRSHRGIAVLTGALGLLWLGCFFVCKPGRFQGRGRHRA